MIKVAVDYLTKWTKVKAIPTGTAGNALIFVKQFLYDSNFSVPSQLISDLGKCFWLG